VMVSVMPENSSSTFPWSNSGRSFVSNGPYC
jgi:hypothetical protein